MEKMFSQAIKREFNRDLIDNKSHLVTLSGGLDSRAVRFVAMKLGYNNVTNITMSQSKYLDYSIALEISNSLNDDFIFFSLDSAKYLYKNIAKSCFNNGGTVLYNGNAHLDHMIDNIDTENYGLLHTGMIGDAIVGGSFIREENLDFSKAQYSSIKNFYPYKVNDSNIRYRTQEMNLLYNRGINGAFNGLYSTQRKVEAYSPFIDPDFIKFIYSLPNEYRKKSKIYIDWMKKYHHDMLKFKWEKTSLKPNSNKLLVLFVKIYKALYRRILISNKKSMNPYDYWYKHNEMFKREIDSKTIEALKILEPFLEINEPINELFNSKKTINKLLVISLANSISVLGIVHFSGEENEKN
jgi:asparagine synthase (glutamine-hydrolysing)